MADITYNVSMNLSKGNLSNSINVSNVTANMTQTGLKVVTYTLTTNAVSISTANLTSVGLCFMRNLSTATASTIQFGVEAGGSFVSFATLRAGEPAVVRLSSGTDYMAIGTSGSRLRIDVTEG